MTHKNVHRPVAIGLSILLCLLFLLSSANFLSSSAASFARGTTVSSSSTTKSTTTKMGQTKFADLVVLKQKDGSWWACNKKTKEKTDYTGVAPTVENGWWYCRNGKVDKTFTGVAENPYGLWYCKKGQADLDFDGYFVRNSMQIYRITGGSAHLYTTDLELSELGIENGVYKDGSETANKIMDLTEHLFQENVSNAAEQGVVRTKSIGGFKIAIIASVAVVFLGFVIYNLRKDKKREQNGDESTDAPDAAENDDLFSND